MTRRRVYYERGRPVEVLTWWGPGGGPHNVLIRRASGELLVRPFRGLRKAPAHPAKVAGTSQPADAGGHIDMPAPVLANTGLRVYLSHPLTRAPPAIQENI